MIFPAGLDLLSPHILASLSSQSFRTNLCLTFCGCHMIQVTSHKSHGSSSDTVTFIRCTRVCRYLICDIEMLLRRILSSRYLIFPFPSRVLILHICSREIDMKKNDLFSSLQGRQAECARLTPRGWRAATSCAAAGATTKSRQGQHLTGPDSL